MKNSCEYLGHVISDRAVHANPKKIECIEKIPRLSNQKHIKMFLGMVGYYRKFVKNFSTTEKELLAVINSVEHFRPYLYGRTFTIYTDHRVLQWLFNCQNPSSILVRWRLRLNEYQYEIKYKPGRENSNADGLSRLFPENRLV